MTLWIKTCGITSFNDAELCVSAGADAIGINVWPGSPRHVSVPMATELAELVRGRIEIVLVTVDLDVQQLQELWQRVRPDWLQLHGAETDATLAALPRAFKAVGLGTPADVQRALRVPGERVLIDARDDVKKGGTGIAPPHSLAFGVCQARATILAGGLGPHNVATAVQQFQPWGVDAASGLESAPGVKDPNKVLKYVQAARSVRSPHV